MTENHQGIVAGFYDRDRGNGYAFMIVTPPGNQKLPDALGYKRINGATSPFTEGIKQLDLTMDDVVQGIMSSHDLSSRVIKQTPASRPHVGDGRNEAIYKIHAGDMGAFSNFLNSLEG